MFSVVWTIGATTDNDGRKKFDKWIRENINKTGVRVEMLKAVCTGGAVL